MAAESGDVLLPDAGVCYDQYTFIRRVAGVIDYVRIRTLRG